MFIHTGERPFDLSIAKFLTKNKMPDLKALNDIHAVHLTAALRLSNSLHITV